MAKPSEGQIRDPSFGQPKEEHEDIMILIEETIEIPDAKHLRDSQLAKARALQRDEFESSGVWREIKERLPNLVKEITNAASGERTSWSGLVTGEDVAKFMAEVLRRKGFQVTCELEAEPQWRLDVSW